MFGNFDEAHGVALRHKIQHDIVQKAPQISPYTPVGAGHRSNGTSNLAVHPFGRFSRPPSVLAVDVKNDTYSFILKTVTHSYRIRTLCYS